MLKRDAVAWRDMQRNQKAAATNAKLSLDANSVPVKASTVLKEQPVSFNHKKKRKRPAIEDEIDALFSNTSHMLKTSVSVSRLDSEKSERTAYSSQKIDDPQLNEVLGAIKKVSKKEGMGRTKKS
jgi:hypothetical protein